MNKTPNASVRRSQSAHNANPKTTIDGASMMAQIPQQKYPPGFVPRTKLKPTVWNGRGYRSRNNNRQGSDAIMIAKLQVRSSLTSIQSTRNDFIGGILPTRPTIITQYIVVPVPYRNHSSENSAASQEPDRAREQGKTGVVTIAFLFSKEPQQILIAQYQLK